MTMMSRLQTLTSRCGGFRLRMLILGVVLALAPLFGLSPLGPLPRTAAAQPDTAFIFTGSEQTYTVPDGVTSLHVYARGAPGGTSIDPVSLGGRGALVTGDLPVTPGETLYIEVGGTATTDSDCFPGVSCLGGFNGGGSTVAGGGYSGGGGGASDVRTVSSAAAGSLASRLLVAAGAAGPGTGAGSSGDNGAGGGGLNGGGAGSDGLCSKEGCSGAGGGGGGSNLVPAGGAAGVPQILWTPIVIVGPADTTAPTTSASYSSGYTTGSWTSQNVQVTLSASDSHGGSGVAKTYYAIDNPACMTDNLTACTVYAGNAFTVSGQGRHTITFFSIDQEENIEATQSVTIQIDTTAPATPTISINGNPPRASGWYNLSNSDTGVNVSVSSSDAGSGIAKLVCTDTVGSSTRTVLDTSGSQTPWSGSFSLPDGVHRLSCTATDVAGNASNAATATAQVDLTAPSASPSLNGQQGSNGWYTGPVTVTWNWSDTGGSGIDPSKCPATSSYTGPDGASANVSASCADIAGNGTTATSPTFKFDQTAPTITLTTPQDGAVYTLNQKVTAAYTCADATSGIAPNGCSGTVPRGSAIPTNTLGSDSFTVTATDSAGHTASKTVSYSVDYGIRVLSRPTTPIPRGSAAIFRLSVVDGQGHNLSSRSLTVTALNIVPASQPWDGQHGNYQRTFIFSNGFAPGGGYLLVVNTSNLAPGSYVLSFQVEGDPSIHTLQFSVR